MAVENARAVPSCACDARPAWARVDDDAVMRMPVVEMADWEELRQCPECQRFWLGAWPEELQGGFILCRPVPPDARHLKEIDHAATLRGYCLARLEEHQGPLKEDKLACKKVNCNRKRMRGAGYCVEHLIAGRFGRHLARLDGGGGSKV